MCAIFNFTCHRENWGGPICKESNTIKIPQHALDYFYFKTGSWWVYKCVQTGERDSVWVSEGELKADKYKVDKKECDCGWGKCYQVAHTYFKSSRSEKLGVLLFIDYLFAFSRISKNESERLCEVRESFRLYENSYPGYKMQYDGKNAFEPFSGLNAQVENIDQLQILGNTFSKILKYSYPNNPDPPDWIYEAWFARNIHLVKYRLHKDNTIWELEKYNIVQ